MKKITYRLETIEEERDRYKKALETLQKIDEMEELEVWIDDRTPLGLFLSMNLNLISYLGKNEEHIKTKYGEETCPLS